MRPTDAAPLLDTVLLFVGLLAGWQLLSLLTGAQVLTPPLATVRRHGQLMAGPDFAVITTRSFYSDTDNGQPVRTSSWVTFTFRRENGEWRLIHDQNTRVPVDMPAG